MRNNESYKMNQQPNVIFGLLSVCLAYHGFIVHSNSRYKHIGTLSVYVSARLSLEAYQHVKMWFELQIFFLLPIFAAFVVFYFWGMKRLYSLQAEGIPCLEPVFPLGNMNGIGTKVHIVERNREIYEAFKKSHKIAGFYSMLRPTIMLLDLDLIKDVLIKDFNNFTDRGIYYHEEADPVSANM